MTQPSCDDGAGDVTVRGSRCRRWWASLRAVEPRSRLDRVQQDRPWLSFPIAAITRFSEHQGGRLAASIAFFAFFSVFPLIVVFISVLDLLMQDHPELRHSLIESALANLPLIGTRIEAPDSAVSGSLLAVVVGLFAALWAGLRAVTVLQQALETIWDVAPRRRANLVMARLRGMLVLAGVFVWLVMSWAVGEPRDWLGFGRLERYRDVRRQRRDQRWRLAAVLPGADPDG